MGQGKQGYARRCEVNSNFFSPLTREWPRTARRAFPSLPFFSCGISLVESARRGRERDNAAQGVDRREREKNRSEGKDAEKVERLERARGGEGREKEEALSPFGRTPGTCPSGT